MRNWGVHVCNLDYTSRLVVNLHHQKCPIGGRRNFDLRNPGPYPQQGHDLKLQLIIIQRLD